MLASLPSLSALFRGRKERMRRRHFLVAALFGALPLALGAVASSRAQAGEVQVAVAANFSAPMRPLAAAFNARSGHTLRFSLGATGKFYAQIVNGAPFNVFLSADSATAQRLEAEGHAVAGSRFTYAIGQLMLWSARPDFVDAQGKVLSRGNFRHLALANPKTAPYGAAVVEVLRALGEYERLQARFVQGENIAQTQQFVASANAELGFVALSQVWQDGALTSGSGWRVPTELHRPIRQDAVLLARGRDNPAASTFLAFLQSEAARAIIANYGYTF